MISNWKNNSELKMDSLPTAPANCLLTCGRISFAEPEKGGDQNKQPCIRYRVWSVLFCFHLVLQASLQTAGNKKARAFARAFCFVGAAGFEPATSWSQTMRDNRTTLRPERYLNTALYYNPDRLRFSADEGSSFVLPGSGFCTLPVTFC